MEVMFLTEASICENKRNIVQASIDGCSITMSSLPNEQSTILNFSLSDCLIRDFWTVEDTPLNLVVLDESKVVREVRTETRSA